MSCRWETVSPLFHLKWRTVWWVLLDANNVFPCNHFKVHRIKFGRKKITYNVFWMVLPWYFSTAVPNSKTATIQISKPMATASGLLQDTLDNRNRHSHLFTFWIYYYRISERQYLYAILYCTRHLNCFKGIIWLKGFVALIRYKKMNEYIKHISHPILIECRKMQLP